MKSKQLGYLGIGNRRALNVVQRPFSPSDLFATGEQGVWYDPSDLSTMFQDSAGTTPVTGVEQPVGLLLDKSKGLVLGSDLKSTGAIGIVGTATAATYNTSTGAGTCTRVNASNQSYVEFSGLVSTSFYIVNVTCVSSSISMAVRAGTYFSSTTTVLLSGETKSIYCSGNTSITITDGGGGSSFVISSIRAIAGNHASQSTSASRPTLSARYNLLTYSEQFNDAVWTKTGLNAFGSGSVANTTATTDPLGGNTAGFIQENTSTSGHGLYATLINAPAATFTFSVYLKAAGRTWASIEATNSGSVPTYFDLTNGVVGTVGSGRTASIQSVGNGWYRCFVTQTLLAGPIYLQVWSAIGNNASLSYTGDGTSGIYVWGAQLIVTNDLTSNAYQRIAAATDYDSDATKFPKYLRFDGSDDSLATSSIDFSGTNKLSIFSALRRLSDSAQGMVLELSATTASNNGTFSLETPSTASGSDFQFISKGTVANTINADDYPNPYSAIITAQSAISTPLSNIRINGLEVDSDAGTQGTGNFGNFPLYVGRRNNASLPFNGRLYGMIVRGAETPEYLVEITETWLFGKSGITLDTTPDYTFVTLSNGDFVVDAYGNNVFIEVN